LQRMDYCREMCNDRKSSLLDGWREDINRTT
jgi:hypothetical protein